MITLAKKKNKKVVIKRVLAANGIKLSYLEIQMPLRLSFGYVNLNALQLYFGYAYLKLKEDIHYKSDIFEVEHLATSTHKRVFESGRGAMSNAAKQCKFVGPEIIKRLSQKTVNKQKKLRDPLRK